MDTWEVVGGQDTGGVIVRSGCELSSPQAAERLSTGATIEALELRGTRLHYKRLTGTGPSSGWISTLVGTSMVLVVRRPPAGETAEPSSAVASSKAPKANAPSVRRADVVQRAPPPLSCAIRPYQPGDGTSLFSLERQCFGADDGLLREWVAYTEAPQPDTFVDVAVATGSALLLGYVAWAFEPYLSARPCLKVLSLAVAAHRRGRRVGEQLLRGVQARGLERWPGVDAVRLTVREDNAAALGLYARLGFEQVAVIRKKYQDCDGLDMKLKIVACASGSS